jgi:hypothetical protein
VPLLLCDLPLDGKSNNSEDSDIPAVTSLMRFLMTLTLRLGRFTTKIRSQDYCRTVVAAMATSQDFYIAIFVQQKWSVMSLDLALFDITTPPIQC